MYIWMIHECTYECTYEWFTSRTRRTQDTTRMRAVWRRRPATLLCQWVILHTKSHVTDEGVMSLMNESCHIRKSHVTNAHINAHMNDSRMNTHMNDSRMNAHMNDSCMNAHMNDWIYIYVGIFEIYIYDNCSYCMYTCICVMHHLCLLLLWFE